ncbi:MAG: (2Fe-2S)-binding protein [Anaerolineae bacterium]
MADEDEVIICRCEEVTKKEILEAIRDGCDSVIWVKRKTRAGMGLCQGKTCGHLVARLLAEERGASLADILPDTRRPPVRPIPLGILEEPEEEGSVPSGG